MKINIREISDRSPVFIVAELSANHAHDFDVAVQTIKAAKEAGADAIKLQTYTPDTITLNCSNGFFRIRGTIWDGKTLYDLYKEAYTPWEWQPELKAYAESLGLILFSSPFDFTAVDFLEEMNVPAYKVASFEISDIPLIRYMASKMKPMIISTGVATLKDIEEAVEACLSVGNDQIALLKCTSAYPAPIEEANLKTIPDMKRKFNTIVGLSDHTLGGTVPVAAVALGAKIIEKHFILNKKIGGPDSSFSMEPDEFKEMVEAIRITEKALGVPTYELTEKVKKSRVFMRSLFVVKNVRKGETFSRENIRSIRPGNGLPPKYIDRIIGKKAVRDISLGTPLSWDLIEDVEQHDL
jgi:pseudaminic acid synthase